MEELIVDKLTIEKWSDKLKLLLNVNSEKLIANEMDISASQYSQMKNNGKFHYEKFINMMIKKGLSIDDFFGIDVKKEVEKENKLSISYYNDKNKYIVIEGIENKDKNLNVIKKNQQHIIFDTNIKSFKEDGIYVFMQNDFILVKSFNCAVNTNDVENISVEISNLKNKEEKKIINISLLEKLNIIGKVKYIVEINEFE